MRLGKSRALKPSENWESEGSWARLGQYSGELTTPGSFVRRWNALAELPSGQGTNWRLAISFDWICEASVSRIFVTKFVLLVGNCEVLRGTEATKSPFWSRCLFRLGSSFVPCVWFALTGDDVDELFLSSVAAAVSSASTEESVDGNLDKILWALTRRLFPLSYSLRLYFQRVESQG